jgi:hypothetical protein
MKRKYRTRKKRTRKRKAGMFGLSKKEKALALQRRNHIKYMKDIAMKNCKAHYQHNNRMPLEDAGKMCMGKWQSSAADTPSAARKGKDSFTTKWYNDFIMKRTAKKRVTVGGKKHKRRRSRRRSRRRRTRRRQRGCSKRC